MAEPVAKLADAPDGFRKHLRSTHVGLLKVEAKALAELRKSISTAKTSVVAAIVTMAGDKLQRHTAIAAVAAAASTLRSQAAQAATRARTGGRDLATARIAAEVATIGAMLGEKIQAPPQSDAHEDAVFGAAAGDAIAAAFRAATLAAILKDREATAAQAAGAVQAAIKPLDAKARRTAATETSRSFNAEHGLATAAMAAAATSAAWLALTARRWDATLDRLVCLACKTHDGELAAVGSKFKRGEEPGDVHPSCRCVSTLILLPMRQAA